jgi:type II secretory pathway pseudopilin PulG
MQAMARRIRNFKDQHGFTLLVVLFLIAGFGVALAALGTLWATHQQREKEAELLFVGDQYRRAIESYYRTTPGPSKQYPRDVAVLLRDPRFQHTVRHLRRAYRDPFAVDVPWGLERDTQGGITAVFSTSERVPFKISGFPEIYQSFTGAADYRGWIFKAQAEEAPAKNAAGKLPPVDPQNE